MQNFYTFSKIQQICRKLAESVTLVFKSRDFNAFNQLIIQS